MTTAQTMTPPQALRAYNAAHAGEAVLSLEWDEPAGCSPRGWLMRGDRVCTGFYLDYGPDHYRFGHDSDIGGGRVVSFCGRDNRLCRDCEPGNILAVRYPDGPGTARESRYCETVADARRFVVSGS